MRILNNGKANFIVKNTKGEVVTLCPGELMEVADSLNLTAYPYLKRVDEPKKEEVEVKKEKKGK